MIQQVRMHSARHEVQNRNSPIFIRYLLSLVVIPQLTLGAGLLLVQYAESVYGVIALPLVLYCAPVVAIFGSAHFFTHGTLYPADFTGCALVVAFYTGFATIASAIHVLISHRARNAEPLRRANRRQPPRSS
jgi:hypothetical protein